MAFPFPAKAPDEKKLLTFNFSTELPSGVTLSNPDVTAIVTFGDDPLAAALIITNVVVNTLALNLDGVIIAIGQAIQCFADAGLEGCHYEFHAIADASNGERPEIVAQLKVHLSAARGK
jgi:hypothetical protein